MPSITSSRLQPYSVQATARTSSTSQHTSASEGHPASSTCGALQHGARRASDSSAQRGKGALQCAGQASRPSVPNGAYSSSMTEQAGLLRKPALSTANPSAAAGARQFRSGMFSAGVKPAAATATSLTSSGTATQPSSSKVRSQSTPRSGGSIAAVPGRPRVAPPGSSSTTLGKLATSDPLAAGATGQKPVSSTSSSSTARTIVSARDSRTRLEDYGSSSVKTKWSAIQTPNASAAATASYTTSTPSGKYSISRSSSGSASGFDAAAEAAASAAAKPHRSSISLQALLQLKRQRHQQQQQALQQDTRGLPAYLAQSDAAATTARSSMPSSNSCSSSMSTASRPTAAYACAAVSIGAGTGPTRVGMSSGGAGTTYLDRMSAASTTRQPSYQQDAAVAAAAGDLSDRSPLRLAAGGSAQLGAAQQPGTAAASAAAAVRQRVLAGSIDASSLLHSLPGYGSTTAGSSVQQAPASAAAAAGGEECKRPQLYRPELYAAADAEAHGGAAARAALLQWNQAQLQEQLQDRLGALQLQPACTAAAQFTDPQQQQQQQQQHLHQQPSQHSTKTQWERECIGATCTASSSSSSTAPAVPPATMLPATCAPSHTVTPALKEQTSAVHQYSSRLQQEAPGHTGTGVQHCAAGAAAAAAAAAGPLAAGGRRPSYCGVPADLQLPPAQALAAAPVRAPHPLYTLSPQQAQQVVQPQQQQQQQTGGANGVGNAAVCSGYSAAAAAGVATDPCSGTSSGGGSSSSAYVNPYRPAGLAGSLSARISRSTSSTCSYYAASAADAVDPPCAPRYSDGGIGSAGPAFAATAAAMYRSSRYSSTGSDAAPGSCSAGSSKQQPNMQQQQQQAAGGNSVGSAASSTMLASRQQPLLIGTHPMSEDVDNGLLRSSADTAAGSVLSRGANGAAAARQAAAEFLTCDFVASRSRSARLQGQVLPQQGQQQQQQPADAAATHEAAAAADGAAGTEGVASHPGSGLAQSVTYAASDDSSDVSDVTEMSTSLEHSVASSSSGSDSEGCAAPKTSDVVWRRLAGGLRGRGSSVSVSTEGRSSSCGSGRDLETPCRAPAAAVSSISISRHSAVSSSSSRVVGQLPCGCMGLHNLGNTCFMNSILQCLNCLPELVAALLGQRVAACNAHDAAAALRPAAGASVAWGPKASVGPALCELLREMWSPQPGDAAAAAAAGDVVRRRGGAVSAARFLEAVSSADDRWSDGCQQDSQEFLHSLLEQLQSECNRVRGKPQYRELSSHGSVAQQASEAAEYARSWHDSLVDDLFGGQLQSTITCSGCGAQSHCFDPFLDLSVPLPRGKVQLSLQDCLSAFVEQEVLTGSEAVKCGSCKRTCDAAKRLQVFQCPRLLVLTLKRFNSGGSSGRAGGGGWCGFSPYSKNQTPVKLDAQHTLDLSPYCNQQALRAAAGRAGAGAGCSRRLYQLVAVSEHSGCLGGGHYTARGRSVADGQWYDFNDACVTADSHPSGSSSSAYVLFFRLVGDCV